MAGKAMIVRGPRLERNFTIVANAVLRDTALSYRASGLLADLLSRPPDYRIRCADLIRPGKEGREAVRSALCELEQAGYLVRRQYRNPDGTFGYTCTLYEEPQDQPLPENPHAVPPAETDKSAGQPRTQEPGSGFSGSLRRTEPEGLEETKPTPSSSNDDKLDNALTLSLDTEPPDPLRGFSQFWEAYPRRNGKRLGRSLCENNWQGLSLEERRAAWRGAKNYAAACASGLQGAMDPQRFLKHRFWVDWQEPAKPDNRRYGTPARPRVTPAEEILAQQAMAEKRREREIQEAEAYIDSIKARLAAQAHG